MVHFLGLKSLQVNVSLLFYVLKKCLKSKLNISTSLVVKHSAKHWLCKAALLVEKKQVFVFWRGRLSKRKSRCPLPLGAEARAVTFTIEMIFNKNKQTAKKHAGKHLLASYGTSTTEDTASEPRYDGGSKSSIRVSSAVQTGSWNVSRNKTNGHPERRWGQRLPTKGASNKDLSVSVFLPPPFCRDDPRDPRAASGRSTEAD